MARPARPRDLETIRREELGQSPIVANAWFNKAQILWELQQLCPAALRLLPHILTFPSDLVDCKWDGQLHPAYHIGRFWIERPCKTSNDTEMVHENLIAVDIGAFRNEMPQLICYVMGGADCVQAAVKANGFRGEGIFQDFINYSGGTASPDHLRIDDPMITNLIQFIQVVRGHREYYALNVPEGISVAAQLASLTRAIFTATRRPRDGHETIATIEADRSYFLVEPDQALLPGNETYQSRPESQSQAKSEPRAIPEPPARAFHGIRKNQVRPSRSRTIATRNSGIKINEVTRNGVKTSDTTDVPIRAASESTVSSPEGPSADSPSQVEDNVSGDNIASHTTDRSSSPEES